MHAIWRGGGVEIRNFEDALHALREGDVFRGEWKDPWTVSPQRADFIPQDSTLRHGGERRLPPIRDVRAVGGAIECEIHSYDLRGSLPHAVAAFRERDAVGGEINPGFLDLEPVTELHPQVERQTGSTLRRRIHLGNRSGGMSVQGRRIVLGPARHAAVSAIRAGAVVDRHAGAADDRLPRLRTGRADDIPRPCGRRELLRTAADEAHLLITEIGVRGTLKDAVTRSTVHLVIIKAWWKVAEIAGLRAEGHLGIDVHTAIELEADVVHAAVRAGENAQAGAVRHPRDSDFISARGGVSRRHTVGIECGIAILAVHPPVVHETGADAVLVDLDGWNRLLVRRRLPDQRHHRIVPGEGEPSARRNDGRIPPAIHELSRGIHERPEFPTERRLVDQRRAHRKPGLHETCLTVRLIVPRHHVEHRRAVP